MLKACVLGQGRFKVKNHNDSHKLLGGLLSDLH